MEGATMKFYTTMPTQREARECFSNREMPRDIMDAYNDYRNSKEFN